MKEQNGHTQDGHDQPDLPEDDATAEGVLKPWFIPLDDFLSHDDTPTEIDYIVDGVLERGGVTIIGGEPETGKSMLTNDMALASVSGQTFMSQRTKEARWVFMDLEMGKANMAVRMRGLLSGRGIDEQAPCLSNLLVPEYDAMPRDGLINPDIIEGLILRLGGCDVFVIDSLRKALGIGNESEAQHIGVIMKNIRTLRDQVGCAVVFVHHARKDEEILSINTLCGSGAIGGEPDVVLLCHRDKQKGFRQVSHQKLRSEPEERKWSHRRFDIVTEGEAGIVIDSPEPPEYGQPMTVDMTVPEAPEADPLDEVKSNIISHLRDAGGWVTTGAIHKGVTGKGVRIAQALNELADAGDIQRKDEGKKRLYSFEAF